MTTPADTLRAAAQRLRELAEKATPGPWHCPEPGLVDVDPSNSNLNYVAMYRYACDRRYERLLDADAEWIAAMSPAIAEPLAAWLELTAYSIEICVRELAADGVVTTGADVEEAHPQALAIARGILPTPSPTGSTPGGGQ